ncbi:MAG: hypothetical protein IH905_00255 [Proteobacteria bacterium]|nr:hypothetical protein [Pseudomonadota bacterium]
MFCCLAVTLFIKWNVCVGNRRRCAHSVVTWCCSGSRNYSTLHTGCEKPASDYGQQWYYLLKLIKRGRSIMSHWFRYSVQAVAAALISSVADVPLPEETVVFGEIGLSGDVRTVSQADLRLKEAAKLGFRRAIVPAGLKHRARPLDITEISQLDDLAVRLTVGERGLARADA